MSKSKEWRGTSLYINSNTEEGYEIIDALDYENLNLLEEDTIYVLENQKSYFIFENEFIDQSKNLNLMIAKYIIKDYENSSKLYDHKNKKFKTIEINYKDKSIYENIIQENNIDGDIRKIPISINVLNKVFDESRKSKVLLDILILLFLADKSSYSAEKVKCTVIGENKSYQIRLDINSESLNLYPIYDWIINNKEYKDSYNVKLQIVRQVIVNKKDICNVSDILENSKLAYKRIISDKTKEYFNHINQLKNDFLILAKNENGILRTLNLTFFTWLGALALKLFDIINNYEGNNLVEYILLSKGTGTALIIFMFLVGLLAIYIGYTIEIKSLQETYDGIRRIYKDKILFENDIENENKFENLIKRPEIGKIQKYTFLIILGLMILRLLYSIV